MGIELRAVQTQKVSQNVIWQVSLLQMSSQELTEYLNELSLENPVVDLEGHELESREQERLRKLEWLSETDEQNRVYYGQDRDEDGENEILNLGKQEEETLADSLLLQLLGGPYTTRQSRIFEYIAKSLDSRGYFTESVEDTAVYLEVSQKEVCGCLSIMKALEPAGVCASGLEECLLLQLARQDQDGELEVEQEIVRTYLAQLGKNQLPQIAKALNLPIERIKKAAERIRQLNPRPASGYAAGEDAVYISPDVTVVKLKDYFEVLVNQYSLPQLRISQDYMRLLRSGECDREVAHYLSEKVRQVEMVQDFIVKRNTTLAKMARFLVEWQADFFQYGKGHLKPLRMWEAAEQLEVHESTVSRCVKNKYLQCCWGTFPLDFFFTNGAAERSGTEQVAADEIFQALKELVDGENKQKPYSDQKLSERLSEQGMPIARRTVAKYREILGIPDCRGRKVF